MIVGLRHVGIVVSDLRASLHFYVGILGFTIAHHADEHGDALETMLGLPHARVTTVKLAAPDGSIIELLQFTEPDMPLKVQRTLNDIGVSHFALTCDDLSAEYSRLTSLGVQFVSAPQLSGSAKVCFAVDPDSNFIELTQVLQ